MDEFRYNAGMHVLSTNSAAIAAFPRIDPAVSDEFFTNFVGAKQRRDFTNTCPGNVPLDRNVVPAFDEEYFEWVDLLESLHFAEEEFIFAEMGAGFGRWSVNAVCANRLTRCLPYKIVAVEAHPVHFKWLSENLRDNGVDAPAARLLRPR
jgi:hypothetical protein